MMNTNEVFNHYSRILDDLISDFNFFKAFFQEPYYLDEVIDSDDYNYDFPCNIKIACGATRCCIVDKDYPYVVKMNLAETDNLSDACEDEISIYSAAVEFGCQNYLTEARYLGEYVKEIFFYSIRDINYNMDYEAYLDEEKFNDNLQEMVDEADVKRKKITIHIPLYGYRRADNYSILGNIPKKEISTASPLCQRNENIGYAFARDWGVEEYDIFSRFLSEYNVNDLHCGNIGGIDGRIVLIDFGGFHDGEEDEEYNY